MEYTVTYDDGDMQVQGKFERPERLPEAGDIYKAKEPFATLAKHEYLIGDLFTVVGRTDEAPHHRKSSLGNLRVSTKYGTSVWTNFDSMVAEGRVELAVARSEPTKSRLDFLLEDALDD